MKRSSTLGGLYFLIHFLVEITSFYVLAECTGSPYIWTLALLYDFLAFVPQGVYGWLRDRGLRVNFALWGTVLTSFAVFSLMMGFNVFLTVTVMALGNCLVHIHGAEITLRSSPGKMTPSAVFVAGGSFGVVTGKLLSAHGVPALWVLLLNALMLVPVFIAERLKTRDGEDNLRLYRFADTGIPQGLLIATAVFVVAVRAYMGYGIPTTWNKTELQTVALYAFMGVGKALGGVLTDRIGIRKTALIATLGAIPFLIFGAELMAVSLFGIALFSMTMAVTLALLTSRLPRSPGVAFGLTTVGLFLGTLPVFFFRMRSVWVNGVMITVLSVLCAAILFLICAKPTDKRETDKELNKHDEP